MWLAFDRSVDDGMYPSSETNLGENGTLPIRKEVVPEGPIR